MRTAAPESSQNAVRQRPDQPQLSGLLANMVLALLIIASAIVSFPPHAEASTSNGNECAAQIIAEGSRPKPSASRGHQVNRLYTSALLRQPTVAGLNHWANSRLTLQEIAERIMSDAEFTRVHGKLTDRAFVELLFERILCRKAGKAGLNHWTRALQTRKLTRADLLVGFSESKEYLARTGTCGGLYHPEVRCKARATPKSKKAPTKSAPTTKPPVTAPPTTARPTTTTVRPPTTARPTTTAKANESLGANHLKLVWSDEFNNLNTSTWKREHSTYGDGNNEAQCYRPENVTVRNGRLVLTAKQERYTCPNGSTRQYTSGMVRSQGVTFSPGQTIEFRIKLNAADRNQQSGLFPAVWSSSWNGGGWPTGGEFDYFEYFGRTRKVNAAVHYADSGTSRHAHISKNIDFDGNALFTDNWHTFSFTWGNDLVWTMDGVETQRIKASDIPAKNNPFLSNAKPITQIKVNFALGGNWTGPIDSGAVDATGNSTFEVDWIRIYAPQ